MKKILCLAFLAAACREERPAAPTAEESAQLNEAEDLLNAEAANKEGPARNGTGPSSESSDPGGGAE